MAGEPVVADGLQKCGRGRLRRRVPISDQGRIVSDSIVAEQVLLLGPGRNVRHVAEAKRTLGQVHGLVEGVFW